MNNPENRKEYVIRFRTRDSQIKSGKRFGIGACQVINEATNESAIVELLGGAQLGFAEMGFSLRSLHEPRPADRRGN